MKLVLKIGGKSNYNERNTYCVFVLYYLEFIGRYSLHNFKSIECLLFKKKIVSILNLQNTKHDEDHYKIKHLIFYTKK